jgi:hypothetical protein
VSFFFLVFLLPLLLLDLRSRPSFRSGFLAFPVFPSDRQFLFIYLLLCERCASAQGSASSVAPS